MQSLLSGTQRNTYKIIMDLLAGLHCAELSGNFTFSFGITFYNLYIAYVTCLVCIFHKLGIPHDVLDRASMIVGLIQDGKPIDRISTDKVEHKEMCYKVCCASNLL